MLVFGNRVHLSPGDVEFLAMVCDVSEATIKSIEEPDALLAFLKEHCRESPTQGSELRLARRLLLPRYLAALGDEAAQSLPWCGIAAF